MDIRLTEEEDRICQLLDNYVKETQKDAPTKTVCRIAGGWVRDKLLGSQSSDIDIALSNVMGLAFAEGLAVYAREKGVETGTISKIAQNPEQSKHLETATFKVFGHDIDLVNLRSEEYTSDSRIPTGISFGTPLEDAQRRDITINALFYNVHSREVEDFTGQGRNDLRDGIIRTPLPPCTTFLDDPLRVLRCIRFASRLGFKIVQEIEDAAKDPVIQKAIINKVTRERVGEELTKMMRGRDPLRAIELIHNLSLYDPVFFVIPDSFSSTFSGKPGSPRSGLTAASVLHYILESEHRADSKLPQLHTLFYEAVKHDPTCYPRLYLATALTPYKHLTYRDKKDKSRLFVELVIRESLKLGAQSHFLDGIPLLFSACDVITSAVADPRKLHPTSERVGIGLFLREKAVHNSATGSHWTSSFLFSLVQDLVGSCDAESNVLNAEQASLIIEKYNNFAQKVENLKLQDAGDMRPLLDGRQTVAALEAKKPGAWVGQVLNKIIEWQLEHPEGTRDECIDWLRQQRGAGRLQIDDNTSEPANKRPRKY
ncbi:hypothetical protein P691DRAFT_792086 [Macrolepiota fuliginosa MF-IS2]|uniref:Poly A polymerase head domain-containing protein n=1 Tax=Macrolepiota fuliginosa MF-IS2 TaxID=1400762 RepID=A0A9P5XQC8_9AGAR|nr:hypothetical protein P691DRAFT_792086 [Macrolepiota fuliginosa MF-IS2]